MEFEVVAVLRHSSNAQFLSLKKISGIWGNNPYLMEKIIGAGKVNFN